MGRKVFISFLGTTNYTVAKYGSESDFIESKFIQSVVIDKYKFDKILIFTTDKAYNNNWLDDGHRERGNKEIIKGVGLCSILKSTGWSIKPIKIPEAKDGSQILKIFQTVYKHLEEGDELIFDITHAFRSIPMLTMVLINYAKLLKNIKVTKILYGAFEEEKTYHPLVDLTYFSELQDWTNAASLFINHGEEGELSKLLIEENMPVLESKIKSFTQAIKTTRLKTIIDGDFAIDIQDQIELDQSKIRQIEVFNPILKALTDYTSNYKKNDVMNGLLAIEWCLDKGLIHQAYTLMSEFIISFVEQIIEVDGEEKIIRDTISSCLSKNNFDNFSYHADYKDLQSEIIDKVNKITFIKKLRERSKSINLENRHDILHAGMRSNPKAPETLIIEAKEKFDKLKQVLAHAIKPI